jgi:hypothetical protein
MSQAINLTPDQSQSVIFTRLMSAGIPADLSRLVVGQSGHETSGWTSNVYLSHNNAFGYGYTGTGYKDYDTVESSADELVGYLNRRVLQSGWPSLDQITDPSQYGNLLKQAGYYEDSADNYINGIIRWYPGTISGGSDINAGLLIAAVMAFVLLK